MKKLMIASLAAAAAVLFSGCEEVKDVYSCDVKISYDGASFLHSCLESEDAMLTKYECEDARREFEPTIDDYGYEEPAEAEGSAVDGTGCPGGAVKVCSDGAETAYYYNDYFSRFSCSELLSD